MARHLCLVLSVFIAGMLATTTASLCPRGLHAVLDSEACSDHRRLMTTAQRTTVSADDDCVNSLRVLLTTAASMPCSASLESAEPGAALRARRLESTDTNGPIKGKFKCKFDTAAPLNVTDLSQGFIVDCEEVVGPYNYLWLWIVLGVIGGVFGIVFLAFCLPCFLAGTWSCLGSCLDCCVDCVEIPLQRRRERKRQRADNEVQDEKLYAKA